ncbi:MAG: TonB-dependent receptor [Methylomarinum sp.]|nr:TonB-dependent receptor [Methylomarinum sp.]
MHFRFFQHLLNSLLIFSVFSTHANELQSCDHLSTNNIVDLDLTQLSSIPVFVSANQKATCTKQAAGIVSVITSEEILNMGARDLIDVLQLVPGFNFGVDISNVVGLGIRGIQAHEGKVAVFIDGINLNEHRFGTTQFGNHFPIEQIDRIEIIRGPGSIVHGNFAEMGVINIISKTAEQIDGAKVSANYGRFQDGEARKNIEWIAGKKWQDLELSFSGKRGIAHRSDQTYHDAAGNSFDMSDNNELDALTLNFDAKYKNLDVRLLLDDYSVDSRDGFGKTMSKPGRYLTNKFQTYAANINFQHAFSPAIKLDINGYFSRQNPWERTRKYLDDRAPLLRERVYVDYYKLNAKGTFASEAGNYLVLGSSISLDKFDLQKADLKQPLPTFSSYTVYTEGSYSLPWFNILAGVRFDAYNEYGTNFAPRIAITKDYGIFHFKALYSHAFRIPTGGNYQKNAEYNENPDTTEEISQVDPEHTRTTEIELGFHPTEYLDWTVNLFHIQSDDIILYTVDQDNIDFFINAKGQDTQGIETGLRYKGDSWGYLDLNYSYYQSIKNTAEKYQIQTAEGQIHKKLNVGFPSHKVTLNAHNNITSTLSLNQTLIFASDKYGYNGDTLTHHAPTWVYNIYLRQKNLFIKGFDVGLGVYDLFNEKSEYVQPYHGGHPALPGRTREAMLKLSYQY